MIISDFISLCGSMSPIGKLVLACDLGIAAAYLAIPIGLLVVWRYRIEDLPYPWMFALFSAFIVACGITHLVHALEMPFTTFEHTTAEATSVVVCALLSSGTASALIAVMPQALRMISPKQRQLALEAEIDRRLHENRELIREINHQLGNQLQIMSSAVRMELRSAESEEALESLGQLETVLNGLVQNYRQSAMRYGHSAPVLELRQTPSGPQGRDS